MNLSPRQLDVIVAVRNYRHLHGYAPTTQELADQLGTTKTTIFEHLRALEFKGVIRTQKFKARSIEIISGKLPDEERSTKLPLLGIIAAGAPVKAVEVREEIDLEQIFQSKHSVYVLRICGDNLGEHHLCHGDFVVIEKKDKARKGEQVVAEIIGQGIQFGRYMPEPQDLVRLARSDTKSDLDRVAPAAQVKVLGTVMGMLRSY